MHVLKMITHLIVKLDIWFHNSWPQIVYKICQYLSNNFKLMLCLCFLFFRKPGCRCRKWNRDCWTFFYRKWNHTTKFSRKSNRDFRNFCRNLDHDLQRFCRKSGHDLQSFYRKSNHQLTLFPCLCTVHRTWIKGVDVECVMSSFDYQPLRSIVNQCEAHHL